MCCEVHHGRRVVRHDVLAGEKDASDFFVRSARGLHRNRKNLMRPRLDLPMQDGLLEATDDFVEIAIDQ